MLVMRSQWGWLALFTFLTLGACQQCGSAGESDGGTGGGGAVGGGSGGGETGGGAGGGSGADAGSGPRLIGCEVDASIADTPECAPASSGCHSSMDCDSGLCLTLAGGGVCTTPCDGAADCQSGWTCQRRWTGAGHQGFCTPARRSP